MKCGEGRSKELKFKQNKQTKMFVKKRKERKKREYVIAPWRFFFLCVCVVCFVVFCFKF